MPQPIHISEKTFEAVQLQLQAAYPLLNWMGRIIKSGAGFPRAFVFGRFIDAEGTEFCAQVACIKLDPLAYVFPNAMPEQVLVQRIVDRVKKVEVFVCALN